MGKPEGAGYVEPSIADRYASMNNIPTDVARSKNPDAMPIGNKAGDSFGYKPQQTASETAPRVGGGS